ncbi:MAG: hypothetical protein WBL45_02320 [Solirubrobacterales bacterium]
MFATLAALVSVLAACGGGSGSSDDPQEVIESATLEGVESGVLDLSVQIQSDGSEGGDLVVSVSGPFQSEGKETLPQLDVEAKAKGNVDGEAIDFEGGLTVLSDRAFVAYEGTEYEVDPTTFGFVKSGLEQAEQGGKDAGNPSACQEAAAGLNVDDFVEKLKNEGSVDIDGTSTTKLSGELNAANAIDALIDLTEDPACKTQLEAAGDLPLDELEEARREVSTALERSHVDLYVGEDQIIRKLAAELTIAPKDRDESVEVDLELSLGEVNEPQQVTAPSGAKPLEILFRKLGINPLELLEAGTSGEGFGDLLESLGSDSKGGGGSSDSGNSGAGGSTEPAGSGRDAYLECLQNAQTPTDLQNCASL